MGKDLYENNAKAKELFEKANEILGFRITDIMFEGSDEDLRRRNYRTDNENELPKCPRTMTLDRANRRIA